MAPQLLRYLFVLYILYNVDYSGVTATQQTFKNTYEKEPLEYKLTNLLDIHVGKESNDLQSSLRESIRSEVRNVLADLRNELVGTKQLVHLGPARYAEEIDLDRDNNLQDILQKLYSEIYWIKKNISDVLGIFSSTYHDDVKNFINKSPVGVSYDNHVCSSFSLKRMYPGNLWKNSSYVPKNCREIQLQGYNVSGIYKVQPLKTEKPSMVLCDMETQGGGWTHIQKRYDGSQDFYLKWREYKFGFGDLEREFWLGLENIFSLTGFEKNELLVELVDKDNNKKYAHYNAFAVGSESDGYPLEIVSGYTGDAGDALSPYIGTKFTTKDFDQDTSTGNCAELFTGAWWYVNCHGSNLNGVYRKSDLPKKHENQAIHWYGFKFDNHTLSQTRMLIRPAQQ